MLEAKSSVWQVGLLTQPANFSPAFVFLTVIPAYPRGNDGEKKR
jgi:hypothetical protein